MCLTAPARVVAVEPDFAVVQTAGRRMRATTLMYPDVRVGDWVVISAGAVVRLIDGPHAQLMAEAFDLGTGEPGVETVRRARRLQLLDSQEEPP
jgi:hydrogenase assembly chaperone HypC/HupF